MSRDGEVFAWGCGREGQLGLGDLSSPRAPQLVHTLVGNHVVQISAGEYHTAALTATTLFTWGDGADGQLGCGDGELKDLRHQQPHALEAVNGSDVLQVT